MIFWYLIVWTVIVTSMDSPWWTVVFSFSHPEIILKNQIFAVTVWGIFDVEKSISMFGCKKHLLNLNLLHYFYKVSTICNIPHACVTRFGTFTLRFVGDHLRLGLFQHIWLMKSNPIPATQTQACKTSCAYLTTKVFIYGRGCCHHLQSAHKHICCMLFSISVLWCLEERLK